MDGEGNRNIARKTRISGVSANFVFQDTPKDTPWTSRYPPESGSRPRWRFAGPTCDSSLPHALVDRNFRLSAVHCPTLQSEVSVARPSVANIIDLEAPWRARGRTVSVACERSDPLRRRRAFHPGLPFRRHRRDGSLCRDRSPALARAAGGDPGRFPARQPPERGDHGKRSCLAGALAARLERLPYPAKPLRFRASRCSRWPAVHRRGGKGPGERTPRRMEALRIRRGDCRKQALGPRAGPCRGPQGRRPRHAVHPTAALSAADRRPDQRRAALGHPHQWGTLAAVFLGRPLDDRRLP